MKILVTGAFGNLGSLVVEKLLQDQHVVFAFDLENKTNKRIAKKLSHKPNLKIEWGNICNQHQVERLVTQVDGIIHLAAVIAPFSESNPKLAYKVNVEGTKNILNALKKQTQSPPLIFSSSFAVFGHRQDQPPPRTLQEPPLATDHYSEQKIQCEEMIQELHSPWAILRLGAMVDSRMRHSNINQAKMALQMSPDNRVEFIHPKDAADAFIRCLTTPEAHNQIHLIGGGKNCQIRYQDMFNGTVCGFGMHFNESDFGNEQLYADWADTENSQRLLHYQQHSFDDFKQENLNRFRYLRPLIKPIAPLIKKSLLLYLNS